MASKEVSTYSVQDPTSGVSALGVDASGEVKRFNLGSAASRSVGTGATAIPLNSNLGTAATKNVGTASDEVPQNSDLTTNAGYDSTGSTIIVQDTLRASVEAATGGRVTVLYDDQGYPSYMARIPAFNLEDIHADFGTGRHPAFIVNGVDKAEIFIGQHLSYVYNNRALSLPGLDPHDYVDWDGANTFCTNKGSGWHLMTNWEWAAIVLWVHKQIADGILSHAPRGNTNYGRAHDEYQETGTRNDGDTYDPGESTGTAHTLTGSGPATWRHDLSIAGIADMVGNIWEWVGGMKIVDGALKMPNDNYYGQADGSWADQDTTLSDPGDWADDPTTPGGSADADLLRAALIKPASAVTNAVQGGFWIDTSGERVPRRGGFWSLGSSAGLGALILSSTRSISTISIGFRPAFVAP